jgi:D-lyxose ketol-isomerase
MKHSEINRAWHEFSPARAECIIGEVSTANDDLHDNFFLDPDVGRFPGLEADEFLQVRLFQQ